MFAIRNGDNGLFVELLSVRQVHGYQATWMVTFTYCKVEFTLELRAWPNQLRTEIDRAIRAHVAEVDWLPLHYEVKTYEEIEEVEKKAA